ncbi:hypothetical protein [Endozoicomonas arenosclerae]|uniref:hypothetical protein n=1 Tax=Endozoicomonas arenosclerae TaxID=1633495 RepID=UPI000782E3C1|nr:hypothetical protein [Endozoicomonas arenosclerae]
MTDHKKARSKDRAKAYTHTGEQNQEGGYALSSVQTGETTSMLPGHWQQDTQQAARELMRL